MQIEESNVDMQMEELMAIDAPSDTEYIVGVIVGFTGTIGAAVGLLALASSPPALFAVCSALGLG